ncbi:RagB/SusD family nutrient uptake outer membrane protein [Chitinophaga rhizophila]|uniref:RagB/SusD family nutrient uptake outer membrane protein n=1 Tax=Chitinophaga rhizophila TaxID=2866212 RepID=A0ABS7GI47_9BACT|nr:RagB/SusD family nutrient uptake outer membrane protein [Chitinophaga rhizophila]MBW8686327.1 RagB/SusD family nutrient uptake outer membrane protein [Chitinophaga rhizophila]
MKTLIKYNKLISLTVAFLLLFGCKKDFLEIDDNTSLYRQTYVKDLSTMQDFLRGIYFRYAVNFELSTSQAYPEVVADNMKPVAQFGCFLTTHYSWTQKAELGDGVDYPGLSLEATAMNSLWKVGYQIANACSFVISETDRYRSENPHLADDIKGQAYAIRALTHFKLVNVFAQPISFSAEGNHPGIPYITSHDISKPVIRLGVSDVYQNIIQDYQRSIMLFTNPNTDPKVMNVYAAKALLARTYLFKGDFTNALNLAAEVASNYPLMTIAQGYPDKIFHSVKSSETETLYQLAPYGTVNIPFSFLGFMVNGFSMGFSATKDIANILIENPADVRAKWVKYDQGDWQIVKFPQDAAPEINPAVNDPKSAYYPPVIRSSEMYLTVSEAAAKLGDRSTALKYLNAIRKRANPDVMDIEASGKALLDSIYKERRKELAFEGLRMFDLQRNQQGVFREDAIFQYAKALPFPSNMAIAPIPLKDVQLSSMSQNDGY